jgi:hypothetical protein
MVWRVCCTASSMAWSKAVPAGMSQACSSVV